MSRLESRITKIEQTLAQTGGAFGPEDQVSDEEFMAWLLHRPGHSDHPRPVLTPAQEAYARHRLDQIMEDIAAQGREHNFKQPEYSEEEIRRSTVQIDQRVYDAQIAADRLAATETDKPQ